VSPPGPPTSPTLASRLLAAGAALALLLHLPWAFTRGDVLRGAFVPFLGAAALALAIRGGRGAPRWSTLLLAVLPLGVPLLGLLAATGLSAGEALRAATSWIGAAALCAGLLLLWEGPEDARRALRAHVLAGTGAALWVAVERIVRGEGGAGPFGRPGIAGPALAALLPVALWGGLLPRRAALAAAVLLAAGCLAAGSRVGIAAACLAVPAGGALASAGRGARWHARAFALAAAALVLGVGLAAAGRLPVPGRTDTLEVRFGLWRAAGTLVAERPWTGHGLGSFPAEVLRVRDPDEAVISRGRRPASAHDDVLNAAAEGGIGAALVLLAWLAGGLLAGVRAARRATDRTERRLCAGATGALVALAVASAGEDVFLDPAPALLAAHALAAVLVGRGAADRPRGAGLLAGALAALALGTAAVRTRDALADRETRRYREAAPGATEVARAKDAAERHLVRGALRWRPGHPEAHYRLGVHQAGLGDLGAARESFRAALAEDPGMTEAWLDIARTYEIAGRVEDARQALEEAGRRDPRRFDVPMRLGHLIVGPEPVPGEASPALDGIAAHRAYNEAEARGPDRFEVAVARARIARRLGSLEEAGAHLRRANERTPGQAETYLESFRLAEVEGRTTDLGTAGILALAVAVDPRIAADVRREAERFLATGLEREAAARRAVGEGGRLPAEGIDHAAADRAFAAAARRFAGLLHGGAEDAAAFLAAAEADAEAERFRASLARYRALLSWATLGGVEAGPDRAARLERLADLFSRAAKVATRVDGDLARHLYARRKATEGAALMERADWPRARAMLEDALADAPEDAEVLLALARTLLHQGEPDAAEARLLEALAKDPAQADAARRAPDLAPLLELPAVDAALGGT
jgi:tetratricopeptide (TPR) repeat protein